MELSPVNGSGSFYCFHQLQLPQIFCVEAYMRFHIPLHTSTYFHEYHKLPAASTRLALGSVDFRSSFFRGVFHQRPWKPIYIHGSFHGSRWIIFISMETSMKVGGSIFTSIVISGSFHGSFHCRWKWKLPLLPSIAASTNILRGSFHELPYTPTYFHLPPRVLQTSS